VLIARVRKIIRDVGPTMSVDDELGDLAAAEAAVNAKDAERGQIVDTIREELRRELVQESRCGLNLPTHTVLHYLDFGQTQTRLSL
jgi:hypothetical protein